MQLWKTSKYASCMMAKGSISGYMKMAGSIGTCATRFMTRKKSISLGVYPVVGLKQARQLAQSERAKLMGNIDPAIDRKLNKQKAKEAAGNSFEATAREWYTKQIHTWAPSHVKDVLRRLEGNVFLILACIQSIPSKPLA